MISELTKDVILSKVFELIDFNDYESASIMLLDLRKLDKLNTNKEYETSSVPEPAEEYDEHGHRILNELHNLIRPITRKMFKDTKPLNKNVAKDVLEYIENNFILRARKKDACDKIKNLHSLNENISNLSMSIIINDLISYINFEYIDDDAIKGFVLGNNPFGEDLDSVELLNKSLYSKDEDYIEAYTIAAKLFLEGLKDNLGNPVSNRVYHLIASAFYELAEKLDSENHPISLSDYNDDYEMDEDEVKEYINELSEYAYDKNHYLSYALNYVDEFNNKSTILKNSMRFLNHKNFNYYLLKELFLEDKELIISIYNDVSKDTDFIIQYYARHKGILLAHDNRGKRIFLKTIRTFLGI